MAPLGPPPYTAEQLQAITSQEERIRAQAELTSYITRARREKQEREERERLQSNAYTGSGYRNTSHGFHNYTSPSIPSYRPVHNPVFNPVYTPVANPSYNPPYNKYNQRGGYGTGRGRGAVGRGRGYTPYHPYARPLNAPMYTRYTVDSDGTHVVPESREAKENEDPAQVGVPSRVVLFVMIRIHKPYASLSSSRVFAPTAPVNCLILHRRTIRLRASISKQADAPKKTAALLMFVSIHPHRTAKLLDAWATARKETPVPKDDMDTAEDAHEWMMPKTGTSPKPQQFTQQADFVAFENDDE
ncbi:hypothetical protein J4E86_004811 [Alternaria arbusti]|uniref:uncharacterized protein n=1 Tax=Alternaria arbusti TaxID=232088 RepID=UPI00221F02C7|nr:uncharacterized protein J4E86_004811 [Alternaria arbusti]KAI4957672.1 hypothetical protein J4E86_004811 [Alternaria arbusti]